MSFPLAIVLCLVPAPVTTWLPARLRAAMYRDHA